MPLASSSADTSQYSRCIHPGAESNDERRGGKIRFGTVPVLVDAQD